MRKSLTLLIVTILLIALAGCNTAVTSTSSSPISQTTSTNAATTNNTTSVSLPGEGMKIALVTPQVGNQPFLQDMVQGLKDGAQKYGFEAVIVECADTAAYEENMRALVREGVHLLIGGTWQAGEAINAVSKESPDATKYCLIDSRVESQYVKCISYREQEGSYLLGMMAAMNAKEDENVFGQVGVSQGPGNWKWTFAYREGVKEIKPDAKFIFNFTDSYADPAKGKQFALQQYAQGAKFIMGLCAGGNSGVFEAALENKFYTSSSDVDATTADNPYIMSTIIKDTKATVLYVLDGFFSGTEWEGGDEVLGIKEKAIGLVHVTQKGIGPVPENLTQEEIAKLVEVSEAIANGTYKIDLSKVPPVDY